VNPDAVRALLRHYAGVHGARSAANFDWALRRKLFAGVDLEGKTMLDIGCGDGRMGLWAAAHGARRVVGLEPEVDGSRAGMQEAFRRTARQIGLEDTMELVTARLQDYDAGHERFDIVLLAASINHLDEDACTRLHNDEQARQIYREHLRRLAQVAAPGAALIVTDGDRRNLFALLGVRNPLAPTIEWEKHQSPRLWARLLCDVGFEAPTVRWTTFNTLRAPGQALLGNRACAYMLRSEFMLRMRRSANSLD
jgi:SAM-dependent methyltransferase